MKQIVLFISVLSLSSVSCSGRKVVVEEWNKGYPTVPFDFDQDPIDSKLAFDTYSVSVIGQSTYVQGEEKIQTVDQSGRRVRAVAKREGDQVRYYDFTSFEPVLFKISPEASENIDRAEKYDLWSTVVASLGSTLIGVGAIAAGPYVISSLTLFSVCMGASGKLSEKSKNEYVEAKKKYTAALNSIVFGKPAKISEIAESK